MRVAPVVGEEIARPREAVAHVGHGAPLTDGGPANLTLYDPAAPAEAVSPVGASKSRNTPFAGMPLPGRVVATFLRGTPTVLDGKLA